MLAAGVRDVEPVGVQVEIADLRVAHVDDGDPVAHIRPCPQFPEPFTGGG